jgi:hypothetical protein
MNGKKSPAARYGLLAAEALGVALVLVLLLLAGLALRLSSGPISLTPLLPLLERAFDVALDQPDQPVRLQAEAAALSWERLEDGPTLSLGQARISGLAPVDELTVSSLSVSLAAQPLLRGLIAPGDVQIGGLSATVRLPAPKPAGEPGVTAAKATEAETEARQTGAAATPAFTRQIEALTGGDGPLRLLSRVVIRDSRITVQPAADAAAAGSVAPVSLVVRNAELNRGSGGLAGTADLSLTGDGDAGRVEIKAAPQPDGFGVTATLAALRPAAFAGLVPAAAGLAVVELALDGTITAVLAPDGTLPAVTASLTAGEGQLRLPEALAASLGLPKAEQRLPIRSLALQGRATPSAMEAELTTAAITFGDDARLRLPAPITEPLPPLRSIAARGRFAAGTLTIEQVELAFPGPAIALAGEVQGLLAGPVKAALRATLTRGLAVNDLKDYWPRGLATDAWDWVAAHIRDGQVPQAEANLALAVTPQGDVTVDTFGARFLVQETTIDYLPPMPPVQQASAEATVDLSSLRFAVRSGRCAGLAVRSGTVAIPDLAADTPSLDLDLNIAGPAAGVVEILAAEPLALTEDIDLQPRQVMGSVDTRLRARLPLLDDLEFEQIDLDVDARTAGLGADNLLGAIDLRHGRITFNVTESGLNARGPISISGIAGTFSWDEDFRAAPLSGRTMHFVFAGAETADVIRQAPVRADVGRYLRGGFLGGSLQYIDRKGVGSIDLNADLTRTDLALPQLSWRKEIGKPAYAEVQVRLLDGRPAGVQSLSLTGDDVDVHGTAILASDSRISAVNLDAARLGRNSVSVAIAATGDDSWDVFVGGAALDLSAIGAEESQLGETEPGTAQPATKPEPSTGGSDLPRDLTVSADIARVWVNDAEPISPVVATLVRRDGIWQQVQASGDTSSGRRFLVTMRAADAGTRTLDADINDVGALLRILGLYADMTGGHLQAQVTLDNRNGVEARSGVVRIKDFRLINAPILAQILNLMTLGGIAAALTGGEGIRFSRLEAPFEERNGFIVLSEAYAHGPSLGLTATGSVDLNQRALDLQGVVVPFFWANNLIGHLPLIGTWLTGGSPVGGVFSAPYTLRGPVAKPNVFVNPVTAVMPSVLRFTIEWLQGWLLRHGRPPASLDGTFDGAVSP